MTESSHYQTKLDNAVKSTCTFEMGEPKPISNDKQTVHNQVDDQIDSHPGRSRLEVIYEDIGEDGPSVLLRPRKQYGSANVVQFTRPISSQDDIPQGFSFEKVKSQQIDFSGRPGQKKYKCMKPNLPETASPVQQLKPAESLLVAQELHQKALPVTSSSRPINVTENPLVSEPRSTISRSVVGPVHEDLRATDRIPEIPDTLNEIQTLDVVGISGQQGTNPSQHVDLARVESNPETIIPKPVLQQWKHPPSKVIRSRKKPQTASPSDRPQTATQAPDSRSAPTDEELLSVLLSRYKREQQRKDAFRTSQQAKDIEIQELKDISDSMHHDLLQAREEIRAKERELSKYYTCTSQWKDKIQKLNDHVKSLEAGHLKLREGSKELQIQQADVRADKAMLDKMLAMVHEEVQYDRSKAETVLIEAKHHMKILEQTVETQKAQLHKDGDLLNAERTRSQRLEDEMAEITKNYHDLTTIFRGQHDTLAHKLDHMIERNDFVHDQTLPQNQAEMKNLLDRCIKILHELQGVDMVKPLDIQNLDISVKNYAQDITQCVQACRRTSELTKESQQKLSSEIQQQLYNLGVSLKGDQALTEQLMDLREVKATIRERLQSTEAALINARQRAVALESREKLHIQKIAALEVEASKNHIDASDSLQAESQIRELKSRNDTLQMQFAEFRRENLDTSEQLQQKLAEISELHLSETDLQSNLDEARKEAIILADERTIYESQAVAQAEQMRKDLSQAASSEQALLESRYMNQLQQLRQEKTVIEDRAEQRQRQLDRLQCEKDMADHLAEQRLQQLNDTEAERNQEVERSSILQSRLSKLELMFEEETKFLAGANEKLRLLTLDLEAKDAEVLRLTASNALTMKTNTRPSTKDASNKSRRMVNWGSTHNQVIVEDSQPAETVKSAAHQENFADSTPRSQISSLGDLSGLFPPTPVLSSRDLDTSKSNSQKTSGESRDVRDEPFSSNRKPVVLYDKQRGGSHRREQLENQTNGQNNSMLPKNTSSLRQPDQPRVDSVQLHESGSKIGPSYTASGKSASKVTNSEKRRALIAGLDKDSRPSKRSNTATTRGLGPIIPDSQTPNGSRMIPARGRKLSKGLIPDDKYHRRFSQELI